MTGRALVLSLFTLALLAPVMYRRLQLRTGAPPMSFRTRAGRLVMALMASLVFVAVASGAALAENGDKDGSKTGTNVTEVIDQGKGDDANLISIAEQSEKNRVSINILWLIVGGSLVLFMQAGFALVETGFTRAKNAAHTMMMNLVIFGLGLVGWFSVGYAFMFSGADQQGLLGLTPLGDPLSIGGWNLIGTSGFFLGGNAYDVSVMGFFFFQLVFMDATATIPTGAMAERWKFSSFCIWGLFVSMLLYPIFGNWVWGGGWLSQLGAQGPKLGNGFVDFAGSSVVHGMGGVAAFWGAKILGARIGKFDENGRARAIPGHHIPMAFLGTFILLVGWMGFNGASTFAGTDFRLTVVITNTIISGSFAMLVAMFLMWKMFGKPDPSMTANGLLGGLVGVTASAAFVSPRSAALIGVVAGFVIVFAVLAVEQKFKIDDPVGAVAVHGACGIWGTFAVGLFADGSYGAGWNGVDGAVTGLFYGGGIDQLLAQLIGIVTLIIFGSIMTIVFFTIVKNTIGLRVSAEDEIGGLDMPEVGSLAYPDFLEAKGPVFRPVAAAGSGQQTGVSPVNAAAIREEVGK